MVLSLLSWTKISCQELVSPVTKFVARDSKATYLPSPDIEGYQEHSFPSVPSEAVETLVVWPVCRSWTKTSTLSLVPLLTRLLALDQNATKRPSAEIEGELEALSPSVPSEATETFVVWPVCRSWTKTSSEDSNATYLPSAEREGYEEYSETRVV